MQTLVRGPPAGRIVSSRHHGRIVRSGDHKRGRNREPTPLRQGKDCKMEVLIIAVVGEMRTAGFACCG